MNKMDKTILTPVEVKKNDKGENVFIVSKEIIDSDGDVIKISGVKLDRFLSNPIMLWSHKRGEPALGLWKDVAIEHDMSGIPCIKMTPVFTKSKNHNLARIVNDLVEEKIIKSASISFMPNWDKVDVVEKDGDVYRVFNETELKEVSIVNIGANPEALAKAYDDGKITQKDLEIFNEEVKEVDYERIIQEKDNKIKELELLLKEQEMKETIIEQDIYELIFSTFGATSDEKSADGDHTNEQLSIYDII